MNNIFLKELNYIKDERIKEAAGYFISLLPDYFFVIPASSTGKYHPDFSLGEGGLVRHTKFACLIANELLTNKSIGHSFKSNEADLIILSLLIHDGLKEGKVKEKFTVFEHPLLISELVKTNNKHLTNDELLLVMNMLECHMGEYNTNSYSKTVLPTPNNKFSRFVHMCDYLSSRKYIDVKMEDFK